MAEDCFILGQGGELSFSGDWYRLIEHPGFSIFGGYLSLLLVTVLFSRKNSWKLWPLLEDMTKVLVPFFIVAELFKFGGGFSMLVGYEVVALSLVWVMLALIQKY